MKAGIISFGVGAVGYLLIFIGCIGSETGSSLSAACSSVGSLLRAPFFYWLPYANSRYFGIDSLFIAFAGNMAFWGAIVAACYVLLKRRKGSLRASR